MPSLPVRCLLSSLSLLACAPTWGAPPAPALSPEEGRAIRALEARVTAASRTTREWALERALAGLAVTSGVTRFENLPRTPAPDGVEASEDEDEGQLRFPTRRPRGVDAGEWRALQAFGAAGGGRDGERGMVQYMLLDVDGDGRRDLVVRTYNGGTSLVWETSVRRRKGRAFVAPPGYAEPSFESGRGGNEEGTWIRLNGRIYFAWRIGRHGADTVALVRPLAASARRPTLTLRYRYTYADPVPDDLHSNRAAKPLPPGLRRTIGEAIRRADSGLPPARPLCPGMDPDTEEAAFRSPHYVMEHIGAAPVRIDGRCHAGRLTGWFGSYTREHGLTVLFCPLVADAAEEPACYGASARRSLLGTAIGIEKAGR